MTPTSEDGINLGSGAPERKRKHGGRTCRETWHRTTDKEKTALGFYFTSQGEVAVVVCDRVAWLKEEFPTYYFRAIQLYSEKVSMLTLGPLAPAIPCCPGVPTAPCINIQWIQFSQCCL